jgi:hypothetical protein
MAPPTGTVRTTKVRPSHACPRHGRKHGTASITIAFGTAMGARTVKVTNADKGIGSCAGCFTVT